ncbi:hypothetical protein NQ318_007408 [Aromia moschata]|uniref:Uncharacterized protein n=1 Tax=Aromia moschata TaxID=1265417 RepID=A0AAV8YMY6_9CUCU|nr:hypothetical protein NQ318_007408 [Aromia moschata]
MYIQANTKFEKLNEMMRDGINKPNLIMEVIFNQWKRNISRHDEQIEEAREALNKVSESLYDERTANKKLILENEKLQEKNTGLKDETLMLKDILEKNGLIIDELNKKIKDLEDNIAQLRIESAKNVKDSIKEEPIEID